MVKRGRKRWFTLLLAAVVACSDCSGITAFAAEKVPEAEEGAAEAVSVSEIREDAEAAENSENTADSESIKDSESGKDAENSEDLEKLESSENSEDLEKLESSENSEDSEEFEGSDYSEEREDSGNFDRTEENGDFVNKEAEESSADGDSILLDETKQKTALPPLHIVQIREGEELPDSLDPEGAYDLPVSLALSEQAVLFASYELEAIPEEEGILVWSILRGTEDTEEGSASLLGEKDDWDGFETVSDSPYFLLDMEEENDRYGAVTVTAKDAAREDGYAYYIRAAFYFGTEEKAAGEFYAAATVPFVPGRDTEMSDENVLPENMTEVSSISQNSAEGLLEEEDSADPAQEDKLEDGNVEQDQEDRLEDGNAEQTQEEAGQPQDRDTMLAAEETISGNTTAALAGGAEEMSLSEGVGRQQNTAESAGSLTLQKDRLTLRVGARVKVAATLIPADPSAKVVWTSSDEKVASVDEAGEITAVAEGTARITAQCNGMTASVAVTVAPVYTSDVSGDIWVSGFVQESDTQVYTGQKITQNIQVYHRGTLLKEKTDYTLSYKNNVNAAAYYAAKAPCVTINLKGQYSGSVALYYTIKPRNLADIDRNGTGEPGYEQAAAYSKNLKVPNPELTFGKTKLKVNKDFVCDYTTIPADDGTFVPMPADYKNGDAYTAGNTYHYMVHGTGNFTGSIRMEFVVVGNKANNFNAATVKLGQSQYAYQGSPLSEREVRIDSVKLGGKLLEPGFYTYDVCAGEIVGAYVKVYPTEAGRKEGYRGCKKVTLKLTGDRDIKEAVTGAAWKDSMPFSQRTVDEAGGMFQEGTELLKFGADSLVEGRDYTIKYGNTGKAGKVTVTFTGMGRYRGSLKKQYVITPNTDPKNFTIVWKNVTREAGTLKTAYQKGGASPDFLLKDQDGKILKLKTDYTVKLKDNKEPGKLMSCEITGKGNYKGYSETVTILVDMGDINQAVITAADKPYSDKKDAWKSKVTVKDANGKALSPGKDYEKELTYRYEGMENGQPPRAGSTVTVTVQGMGYYDGTTLIGTYRIYQKSIGSLKFAIDAQEYIGTEVTLRPAWEKDAKGLFDIHAYANATDAKNKKNEIYDRCYEILEYKNNSKAGTAKVTLHGIGDYGGTVTCSFKIQKKLYGLNRVTGISLDKTSLTMKQGAQQTLTAVITPQEVSNPTVIWTSSNSKIATVETDPANTAVAVIRAKEIGSVKITAVTQDGNKKAECKLTVTEAPLFTLKEAGKTIKKKVGETYQLTLEWEDGQEGDSSELRWESNMPERISVDQKGLLTMKQAGAAVITVSKGKYTQQCYAVAEGEETLPEGKGLIYEQKQGTTDDTPEINKLLRNWEWNPNTYDYMYLPAGVYHIDAVNDFGGIVLTDNQKLVMSPGALLIAIGNDKANSQVIFAFGRNNVTISGGQIIGERNEHTGSGGEWGHGINIAGCTNVHISDVEISQCWGDGIYLGAYDKWNEELQEKVEVTSSGITIENCNLHHNRRNNLSITDADNITINNCKFNYANGTDPQFGIDIEPNISGNPCEHVRISNSEFKGNAKGSMGIMTPSNDITVENCTMDGIFWNDAGSNVTLRNTRPKSIQGKKAGSVKQE